MTSQIFSDFSKDYPTFPELKKALIDLGLIVKTYRDLHIVSYPKYLQEGDVAPDYTSELVRECRGLIFEFGAEGVKVVCPGIRKFYDNETDKLVDPDGTCEIDIRSEEFKKILTDPQTTFEHSLDGSLVRLYYHNDRWRLATTRCIDASRARWHSYRTFKSLFDDAITLSGISKLNMEAELDTSTVYYFILAHPENRIVTAYNRPQVFLLEPRQSVDDCVADSTENRALYNTPETFDLDDDVRSDPDKLLEFVNNLDWQIAGIVVSWKDDKGNTQRTKLRNANYEKVARLRGNRRSTTERYLELMMNPDRSDEFKEYLQYYPENAVVEKAIDGCVRYIHQTYLEYFVRRNIRYVNDPKVWDMLLELHKLFMKTGEPTRFHTVKAHLMSLTPKRLAELLEPKRN